MGWERAYFSSHFTGNECANYVFRSNVAKLPRLNFSICYIYRRTSFFFFLFETDLFDISDIAKNCSPESSSIPSLLGLEILS